MLPVALPSLSQTQHAAVAWLVEAKPHDRGIWSPVPFPQSSNTTVFFFPQPLLLMPPSKPALKNIKGKRAEGNVLLCQAAGIRGLKTLHKAGIDG